MGPPPLSFWGGGDKNESRKAQATLLCQHMVLLPEIFMKGNRYFKLNYHKLRLSTPALVLYCEFIFFI